MDAVTAAKNRIDMALAQLERKVLELKARSVAAAETVDDDLFAPLAVSPAEQTRIAELEAAGRQAADALGRAAEAVREVLTQHQDAAEAGVEPGVETGATDDIKEAD